MSRIAEFEESRSLLLSIAYRILGSVSEAEDAVHEAWLRYEAAPAVPASGKAFLSAEVTRISTEALRSARVRREKYVRPRPPEPLVSDLHQGPERPGASAESLSTAAVLLLERLSPLERSVFVLREIFGCASAQIASATGCSEEAIHQLAATVSTVSDSGGEDLPWPRRIVGREHVARALDAIVSALFRIGVTMEPEQVKRHPRVVFRDRNGTVLSALALDILDGRVQTIRWVIGPHEPGGPGTDTPAAT
ncbi:sigma factor-like helix-turn-helix DNA-binding protein [Streptomyces sp. NBC_01483]|uniref:sigma factor-like helix-turn-helix DNA-binding protein n=1 Tax=Streptomyces sp. NBC_01483 TaxID=2903883 RepID=UPI002E373605|nr:sigma factor-like helix-turn-helix DNA-binding protein [Streptomyces sp. NBC_01483]